MPTFLLPSSILGWRVSGEYLSSSKLPNNVCVAVGNNSVLCTLNQKTIRINSKSNFPSLLHRMDPHLFDLDSRLELSHSFLRTFLHLRAKQRFAPCRTTGPDGKTHHGLNLARQRKRAIALIANAFTYVRRLPTCRRATCA